MINHIRTLLLNRPRSERVAATDAGEEYVPQTFLPRKLPPPARQFWATLFGGRPDRLFLNYRLRQITQLIHASELAEFAHRDDPRVTYLPFSRDDDFAAAFGVTTVRLAGTSPAPYILGTPVCDELTGRCRRDWRITFLSDTYVRVEEIVAQPSAVQPCDITFDILTPLTLWPGYGVPTDCDLPPGPDIYAYSVENGISSLIELPGSGISLRFSWPGISDSWRIRVSARPTTDFGELLAYATNVLGPNGSQTLVAHDDVLSRVWQQHPDSVTRYAALLLGLAATIANSPQEAA